VHLGEEYGAVELASTALSAEQVHDAEQLTNEIIGENLSVEIVFAEGIDLDKLPLRRIPKREGRLRVIKIGEFDYSACGGTHCICTAEVGLLKIISVEKQRGNTLIKFLSGEQSLADYQRRFEITDKFSQTFTCNVADLPSKVSDLASRNKSMRREISELQKQLMPIRVEQLSAKARKQGTLKVVCQEVSDLDGSVANTLASKLAERITGVAIIATEGRVIIATSKSSNVNAGELVKRLCENTAFRGGGSERLAQVGDVSSSQFTELASSLEEMIADV
jgi:alanyl-tRNA synthetase